MTCRALHRAGLREDLLGDAPLRVHEEDLRAEFGHKRSGRGIYWQWGSVWEPHTEPGVQP